MLNRLTLMGRLCADPELRTTQNGVPVCSFRLAAERDYPDANGERVTDFFDVVAWRGTAEFVSKYLSKGRMAVIDGRLQLRDWTDREGNKRRAAEVIADSVYFGDSKPADAQSKAAQNFTAASNSAKELPENFDPFSEVEPADGGLPF